MTTRSILTRRRNATRLIFLFGGLGLGAVALVGFLYRDNILYTLRLLNAKRIADAFYATSPNVTKNIAYGSLPREKLDVYQPAVPGPHPVLIWVHGGSWNSGDKELYAPVAQKTLHENLVIVIPSYTLHPEANAFQQAAEIARAFAWTRENISNYGGDPNRIVLGGQSAGAHLTGLVALDASYLAKLNHSPQEICGWYGIAGPYSIHAQFEYETRVQGNNAQLLFDVFGAYEQFARGSPQTFARADAPPILLIHGDRDETVPLAVSENFQNALRAQGAPSELKIYRGAGHAGLLFDALAQEKPALIQDLVSFAKACAPVQVTRS